MPIAIVGMHRSGTSMLTRMLHLAGLELGPVDKLMGPAFDNPDGFWENLEFVHINELLLHHFGGSWSSPPAWPVGWTTDPGLDEIRRAAVNLPGKMLLCRYDLYHRGNVPRQVVVMRQENGTIRCRFLPRQDHGAGKMHRRKNKQENN